MKFKLFLENELNSGGGDFSKIKEWETVMEKAKLQDINVNDHQIYEYKGTYYLIKDNQYVAHVQDYNEKLKNKTLNIISASSEERGAYRVLLIALLQKIKYIVSDSILSVSATKFWEKIIKDTSVNKVVFNTDDNIEYRGNDSQILHKYFQNPDFRIGLTSKL